MNKAIKFLLLTFLIMTINSVCAQDAKKLRGAIFQGNVDEVRAQIDKGVDVNEKFNFGASRGITPLFLACNLSFANSSDKIKIIKILIKAGANVNEKYEGINVLGQAIILPGDYTEIVKPLVEGGLDINEKNMSGRTPLHGAIFLGKIKWVEPLIENGADLNAKDKYGCTPLYLAVENNNFEVIEILLKAGADVKIISNSGKSPLDIAQKRNDKKLIELLSQYGAISNKNK